MKSIMNPKKILLQLFDITVIIAVNMLMYLIYADNYSLPVIKVMFIHSGLMALFTYLSCVALGVYRFLWRYADLMEYMTLVTANLLGGVCYMYFEYTFNPGLISFVYLGTVVMALTTANAIMRLAYQLLLQYTERIFASFKKKTEKVKIAIAGAGANGTFLARSLLNNPYAKYKPICFLDKDKRKIGSYICGINVLKSSEDILKKLQKSNIQKIVIAEDNMTPDNKKYLYDMYAKSGLEIALYDYNDDDGMKIGLPKKIRDIKIEDLLFRDSVSFDDTNIREYYYGKTVLITGGGGSIGSELCRQIAKSIPKKLIILDIYENNAYEIQQWLKTNYGGQFEVCVEIASVRDAVKMELIFENHKPDVVFHAAAYKHVPLMEDNCDEAIKNNVFGTYNVINAAEAAGVKKFIGISTDKAVNPTNMMGASKRLCEMMIQSKSASKTDFIAVRFGNVLGSNGSVIPLFKNQIENGGPITITDKRIIRYFMTIPEAAQLVIQASVYAARSDIFVLDMGQPVRILTLAETLIKLAGLRPYEDIDIVEIGLRPGEKLYEELLLNTKTLKKTENEKIYIEYGQNIKPENIRIILNSLQKALDTENNDIIRKTMMEIIPTFLSADDVNKDAVSEIESRFMGKVI